MLRKMDNNRLKKTTTRPSPTKAITERIRIDGQTETLTATSRWVAFAVGGVVDEDHAGRDTRVEQRDEISLGHELEGPDEAV